MRLRNGSFSVRRVVAWVAAVALGAGAMTVFQVASPAVACACGAPAPVVADPNGDVMIDQEFAIISSRGTTEQIDMRLAVDTVARDSGLIMPTPGPAVVSLGDASAFEALAVEMTPKEVTTRDWWHSNDLLGLSGGGAANDGGGAPVVLDVVQLGPLEATILAASDAQGLSDWLDSHGYGLRAEVADLLQTYVDRDWYFVAIKLTNPDALDGGLDPIRFVFDTPSSGLVYPLLLSQAARTAQTVNVYIFDDHRRDIQFADGGNLPGAAWLTWAAPVSQASLLTYGHYLSAYTLYFSQPDQQISDDLVFPQALNDDEYGTVVYNVVHMTFLGIPLGWLGVVVVLVIAVAIVVRVRRRTPVG